MYAYNVLCHNCGLFLMFNDTLLQFTWQDRVEDTWLVTSNQTFMTDCFVRHNKWDREARAMVLNLFCACRTPGEKQWARDIFQT